MKNPINWQRKKPKIEIDARPLTAARDAKRNEHKAKKPRVFAVIPQAVLDLQKTWEREIMKFADDQARFARRLCADISNWMTNRRPAAAPVIVWGC
jgi:hypothetical protein